MLRKLNASFETCSIEPSPSTSNNPFPFFASDVISCYYKFPLKIVVPKSISETCCQWIYVMTLGAGLVEGDFIDMYIKIGNKSCVLMTTLGFPKTYSCEIGLDAQQHVKYDICSDALLCIIPDPLVCYKKSSYVQTQSFYLSQGANVVSLDWFSSGRYDRGENWEFTKFKCVSTFYMNNELVFKEAQNIQNSPLLSIKKAMKSYNCFGTCIIIGPYLSFLSARILEQLGKCLNYGEKYQEDSLFAVSPLYINGVTKPTGCIARFAVKSVHKATEKLEELLEPLFEIIGKNPFRDNSCVILNHQL